MMQRIAIWWTSFRNKLLLITGKVYSMIKRRKKLWIIIPSVTVFVAAIVLAGIYFYYYYYSKAAFEENEFNTISQSAGESVVPGEEITYEVGYKNTANLSISDLTIKTKIPGNTEFISADENFEYSQQDNTVIFDIGDLEEGSQGRVGYTVGVKSPCDNGTVIEPGPIVFDYTIRKDRESFTITEVTQSKVVSAPDFSNFSIKIVDIDGDDIKMDDNLIFKITLENSGNMNAKNVHVISKFSEKLFLYVSSLTPDVKAGPDDKEIEWTVDELAAKETKDFRFCVRVGKDFEHLESFKNTAVVKYGGKIENEVYVEGEVYGTSDFSQSVTSVEDIDGAGVWAGDTLKYGVMLENSGIAPGKDIKVVCPIPKNTTLIEGSIDNIENASYDESSKSVIFNTASIEPGEKVNYSFDVRISSQMIRGGKIESAFYVENEETYFEMEPSSISVRSYVFTTIVCMGDSQIVKTNWPAILDHLLESRYPRAEFTVIGSGINQEMAYQGSRRFDSTVAGYGPQIIVFGYGTNDVGAPGGTALLWKGTNELIQKAKSIGATPIVHSIGWINTSMHPAKKGVGSYNATLADVCSANGVSFVDIYGPMSSDPGRYVGGDGMHWNQDGAGLVANIVFNTLVNYLDEEGRRK